MNNNGDGQKLDWMYKGPNGLVDREEYLLGRSVDKTLEQLNAEEKEKKFGLVPPKNHVEHECIPPSIRDFNKVVQAEQVDISAKLQEDPLVAMKKREEEARRQFLQNPVQLKKLQEALQAQQSKRKKKGWGKSKISNSDSDLDNKIAKKLKYLKQDPALLNTSKKLKKKSKNNDLDIILMHKFNQLKDRLSQEDLNDILAGNVSDSDNETKKTKKQRKRKGSSSEESDSNSRQLRRREQKQVKVNSREQLKKTSISSSSSSSDEEEDNKYRNKKELDRRRVRERSRERSEENRRSFKKNKAGSRSKRNRSIDRDRSTYRSSDDKEIEKTQSKYKSERNKANEKNSKTEGIKETMQEQQNNIDGSESDLESKILKKLRMLRDSVKSKEEESIDNGDSGEKPNQNHQKENRDSSNSSSTNDSDSESDAVQKSRYYDSDSDAEVRKPKTFGLVKSDGTKLALNRTHHEIKKPYISATKEDNTSKRDKKNVKRLTEEEKEKLRREMMKDAEKHEVERSDNLRRYREEDRKEEKASANYDKDFMRKELLKSTKDATVETRIKSNLNKIQRSSRQMDTHFSRRK